MNQTLTLAALPVHVRQDADLWHRAFMTVSKPVNQAFPAIAKGFGVSVSTCRTKYYAWKRSGKDRLSLVNRAKLSHNRPAVHDPDTFYQWFKAKCESNQRSSRAAHRDFCEQWHRGDNIPGLDNSLPRHRLPVGCSYENLSRQLKDKFALDTMRRGLGHALAYRGPRVFTTRVGLRIGQYFMFDDLWHDHFVVFAGQVVRVLEFDALDVASGFKCAWGTAPRIMREDGTMSGLKSQWMRMLVADLLMNRGFSPAGCTLLAELATAAIPDSLEALLHDRTDGVITVERNKITGRQQAILGAGYGRGKGNPRFKASLESLRNLIHNELAALPAQTGLSRDARPEQTHGILCETSDLLKAVAVLAKSRPQVANLIRLPVLQYHAEFLPLLGAVYDQINRRTWHDLEGWEEAGHVTTEYRLSPNTDQWLSQADYLALPDLTQQLLRSAITSPGKSPLMRQRKLSPHEVWSAHQHELVRIPSYVAAEILGDDFAREVECKNSFIEFHHSELSPGVLRFDARITDPDGHERELASGKYKALVNPYDLHVLFLHNASNRFLGTVPRNLKVQRGDLEAKKDAYRLQHTRLSETMTDLGIRHLDKTIAATERIAHNADVLAPELKPRDPEIDPNADLAISSDQAKESPLADWLP